MKDDIHLLRGTLDLLVLRALSWESMHGYAVLKWLRASSRETLDIEERGLYVALHRLEEERLIRGRWRVLETGRRAKMYEITPAGRERMAGDLARWQQYVRSMGYVLQSKPAGAR
jgi:PadR family transcriptional regulator PadR